MSKKDNFPRTPLLFRLKFGAFPLEYTSDVGVLREKKGWANQPWNYFRGIPTRVISHNPPILDRRTNGRTDRRSMTIPRYAKFFSRGKKTKKIWIKVNIGYSWIRCQDGAISPVESLNQGSALATAIVCYTARRPAYIYSTSTSLRTQNSAVSSQRWP